MWSRLEREGGFEGGREGLQILHCDFTSLEISIARWQEDVTTCTALALNNWDFQKGSDCWVLSQCYGHCRTNRTSRPPKLLTNPSHAPVSSHARPSVRERAGYDWEEQHHHVGSPDSVFGRQFNNSAEKGNKSSNSPRLCCDTPTLVSPTKL